MVSRPESVGVSIIVVVLLVIVMTWQLLSFSSNCLYDNISHPSVHTLIYEKKGKKGTITSSRQDLE